MTWTALVIVWFVVTLSTSELILALTALTNVNVIVRCYQSGFRNKALFIQLTSQKYIWDECKTCVCLKLDITCSYLSLWNCCVEVKVEVDDFREQHGTPAHRSTLVTSSITDLKILRAPALSHMTRYEQSAVRCQGTINCTSAIKHSYVATCTLIHYNINFKMWPYSILHRLLYVMKML